MKRNGPIWDAVKRGGRVAYHGYRRRRLEGKLSAVRAAEARAWSGNPTGIPGELLEVRYRRSGRDRGRYVHRFGPGVHFKLGPGRSRLSLVHARGEPIWADERGKDFDKWVDLDHHRRHSNPRGRRSMARRSHRRRRRSSSRSGGFSTQTWLLIGLGGYLWYSGALNSLLGVGTPGFVPIGSASTAANATAGP